MDFQFAAVLFDFDGVLGNTMEANFLAWQNAMRDVGVAIDRNEYFLLEGMKLQEIAKTLCERAGKPCDDPEALARSKEKCFLENKSSSFYSGFYPGAEEFLLVLRGQNIPLALVTGARRDRLDSSLPPDFLKNFRSVVTSDLAGRGKPFPDPYLAAAKELGVSAGECVVLENAPLGIQAAKSAGAYCIAIASTLPENALQQADQVVATLADARKFLIA